nr:lipid A-modifier LpxR family protein [Lutimaribacter sp. EGI FJ00013]
MPADRGYDLTDMRTRLRLGVHHDGRLGSLFYGLTWLGKEFEAQPDGQLTGSLRLRVRF